MGDSQVQDSLVKVLWSSRLCVLLVAMLVYSFGFATLVPNLPALLTNFFASEEAGTYLDCESFTPQMQPAACQNAHAVVVRWTSWTSLVANSFLSFLFSPLIGDLSDSYGRKPFILAGLTLSVLPVMVVLLYLLGHISLIWYYPCNAITSVIPLVVVFLSYAADVLQPQLRTAGFGLIIAAFSTGFMIGPSVGSHLEPAVAALVAGCCTVVAIGIAAIGLPESLNKDTAAATAGVLPPVPPKRRPRPLDACMSVGRSWALINSRSLFRRLAVCMAIVGVVSEGIQDMLIQYLQLTVGFNTSDTGLMITIMGAANLVVQAVLLPWLTALLGERVLLLFGLVFSVVQQALLATTGAKWQAFVAISFGSLASVSYPAISSIKSTHARADQQGLVQGALSGIRALSMGIGPLIFAQLFAMCTKTDAVFGYHPGIVFWTTASLTVLAAAVAASIPAASVHRPGPVAAQCPAEPGTGGIMAGEDAYIARIQSMQRGGSETVALLADQDVDIGSRDQDVAHGLQGDQQKDRLLQSKQQHQLFKSNLTVKMPRPIVVQQSKKAVDAPSGCSDVEAATEQHLSQAGVQ
eukprot:GHRR01003823.1.p1 GENE.GHRR01003823.1~~GHRR01003823.1.p1  ORF type:complete len:579 (+),score=133.93 GHRR01003823.1:157-1893(+)